MAVEDPTLSEFDMREQPAPPRVGVLEAMRRSIPAVVVPVVLLVGAALAYGLLRTPTYTSEARLNVGGLSLTTQTLPGYTYAVGQLAVAYSRAIDATDVVAPIARRFHLSLVEAAKRIDATPIEGSPVIRIRGTSEHKSEAVQIADSAADSLISYAQRLNAGASASAPLLRQYVAASRALRNASAATQQLKGNDPRRPAAQVREDIARLQVQTAAGLYQQAQVGRSNLNLVQKLAPAAPATSDRSSVLQQLLAAGLIAGLLIGIGLAILRVNRLVARRIGAR